MYENYMELIIALRSVESRSKGELLKEAADTLERMGTDLEALMWHSGDGCEICAHKVVEQRTPYRSLGCALGGVADCRPLWYGVKGGERDG